MPVIYAPRAAVLAAAGRPAGMVRTIRVVTRAHDEAAQRRGRARDRARVRASAASRCA